jgi:intracellular septation protein
MKSENAKASNRREVSPFLKLALELGPLVVFFLGNSYGDRLAEIFPVLSGLGGRIFVGTAVFMVAMLISQAISLLLLRHIAVMPLVTLLFVLVFGGLTLWLQDELFIKMKPTIVNCLFAAALLGGLLFGKSLLAYVFDSAFRLDDAGWRKLTWRFGLLFLCLAALNEIVWRSFSTDTWVAFKTWGVMPLTMVFMMIQLPMIQRHTVPETGSTIKDGPRSSHRAD